jgi:hypothetical protein
MVNTSPVPSFNVNDPSLTTSTPLIPAGLALSMVGVQRGPGLGLLVLVDIITLIHIEYLLFTFITLRITG